MTFFFVLLCGWLASGGAQSALDARLEQELKALRREFFEAQRTRDRAVLERVLAPGFTFSHSTGRLERRDEYIARLIDPNTAPPPEIEFAEDTLRLYSDHTVIWTTRSSRRGTDIHFRSTDVLVKLEGRWQWASVHSTRLPK